MSGHISDVLPTRCPRQLEGERRDSYPPKSWAYSYPCSSASEHRASRTNDHRFHLTNSTNADPVRVSHVEPERELRPHLLPTAIKRRLHQSAKSKKESSSSAYSSDEWPALKATETRDSTTHSNQRFLERLSWEVRAPVQYRLRLDPIQIPEERLRRQVVVYLRSQMTALEVAGHQLGPLGHSVLYLRFLKYPAIPGSE